MLEVRAPSLTSSKVSKMGCAGPAFLGEARHSLWELLRQAQEVKEVQGPLQDGVHSVLRPLGFGPLCCREAVSTKVHASPGLRGSLHHSNLTPLLKRVVLSTAVIFKPRF